MTLIDHTGQTFGRWTVLGRAPSHRRTAYWSCRCECGTVHEVAADRLRSGESRSCGCLRRDSAAEERAKRGHWHPLYQTWIGMKQRCYNPYEPAFDLCGGGVCDRWRKSFENFLEDVGEPLGDGRT